MTQPLFEPSATARIRWLRADEGGRREPPTGPIYAATAVFGRGDDDFAPTARRHVPDEHVSIVLRFVTGEASTEEARGVEVDFLARELVKDRLIPGAKLLVMEGAHPVAEGEVISVLI
jgi:hypothetical protein